VSTPTDKAPDREKEQGAVPAEETPSAPTPEENPNPPRAAGSPGALAPTDKPLSHFLYGATELKLLHPIHLRRALLVTSAGAALLGLAAWGGVAFLSQAPEETSVVVVPYIEMAAPPPIDQPVAPQVAIAQPSAPPSVGAPLPVPDAEAEPEQTIATQEELSDFIGEGEGEGSDSLIIAPVGDALPSFGDFVYVEELPQAITRVPPDYPDIARQSGIEGTVMIQALVGKDGKVKDTKVVKSIPVLDDAATSAVRQWVFKPALTNNKPVAVWVAVPVRFTLTGG
jgi:protein TonB